MTMSNYKNHKSSKLALFSSAELYLYNVNVGDLCLIVYQSCYMQGTNRFLV